MLLPLVAHFMGEGLQQLQIAGVGEEVPGVETDLVFPRRPVPGDEAVGLVVTEMLAFVLEGQERYPPSPPPNSAALSRS